MRLLLDEHMSEDVADALRSMGFDVVTVREIGLEGKLDRVIWERAIAEDRVVVSYDTGDFCPLFDTFFFEGVEHPGLVVISSASIPQNDFGTQIRALRLLLTHVPNLANRMVFLEPA